jgi:antitoxin (DNA-binding transcriptional repressor) of toxin-antitoxin stability system
MICATLKDAKATLNKLVEYATAGEDVILMKGSRHVAAIVSISEDDLELSSRLSDAKAAALWKRIDEEIADRRAKEWKVPEKVRA